MDIVYTYENTKRALTNLFLRIGSALSLAREAIPLSRQRKRWQQLKRDGRGESRRASSGILNALFPTSIPLGVTLLAAPYDMQLGAE